MLQNCVNTDRSFQTIGKSSIRDFLQRTSWKFLRKNTDLCKMSGHLMEWIYTVVTIDKTAKAAWMQRFTPVRGKSLGVFLPDKTNWVTPGHNSHWRHGSANWKKVHARLTAGRTWKDDKDGMRATEREEDWGIFSGWVCFWAPCCVS